MNLEEITLEKIKERLKESWDCSVHNNEVEWLIAEVERMRLAGWVDLSVDLDHQRRHRKWALRKARSWMWGYRRTVNYWRNIAEMNITRAEKAEAERANKYGGRKMKKLCKTCFYWHQHKPYYDLFGEDIYGKCTYDKFIYFDHLCYPHPLDALIYWDHEEHSASFATGPEFGCVHWAKKEKER